MKLKRHEPVTKRKGEFVNVGENLYRYTANKTYYGVFRTNRKVVWKSLKTKDPELARRFLRDEMEKAGKIDPQNADMNLEGLLALYEQSLAKFAEGTQENRKAIVKKFRESWGHGLDMKVGDVTRALIEVWLAGRLRRNPRTQAESGGVFREARSDEIGAGLQIHVPKRAKTSVSAPSSDQENEGMYLCQECLDPYFSRRVGILGRDFVIPQQCHECGGTALVWVKLIEGNTRFRSVPQ